jgi:hypothetical protein
MVEGYGGARWPRDVHLDEQSAVAGEVDCDDRLGLVTDLDLGPQADRLSQLNLPGQETTRCQLGSYDRRSRSASWITMSRATGAYTQTCATITRVLEAAAGRARYASGSATLSTHSQGWRRIPPAAGELARALEWHAEAVLPGSARDKSPARLASFSRGTQELGEESQ